MTGHVYFVGAGPGDPELLTVKGRRVISEADLVLFADSLVHPGVAALARPEAEVLGTAALTLPEIVARMVAAARQGKIVARVQSGDPSMYGAIHEQMAALEAEGIPYTIIPGVSSAFAAAARLGIELTVPGISQTVIFTRVAKRTDGPPAERLSQVARAAGTVVLFLSATTVDQVVAELLAAEWPPTTPAAIAYRVGWEDEQILRCPLSALPKTLREARITRQALLLVGRCLDPELRRPTVRSRLYRADHSHLYRKGQRG